jgi:hypothetical protein
MRGVTHGVRALHVRDVHACAMREARTRAAYARMRQIV